MEGKVDNADEFTINVTDAGSAATYGGCGLRHAPFSPMRATPRPPSPATARPPVWHRRFVLAPSAERAARGTTQASPASAGPQKSNILGSVAEAPISGQNEILAVFFLLISNVIYSFDF